MNDQQQAELRALREEQRVLQRRLGALGDRLARFEREADDSVLAEREVPAAVLSTPTAPPPLPEAIPPLAVPTPLAHIEPPSTTTAPNPVPPPLPAFAPAAQKRESLEMRIGSTWLVRAGIIVMLTFVVFLGNYLYHHIVPHLGPASKVALLYVGAGGLTGAGAWLERSRQAREQSRLRDYARVVFAGGLSAVYYVTYAAHYFENLRVIQSSLVAGALLLVWTAFMVFLAHRRNSETLATIAILLAYYTSAINEGVAAFTLFSNLALTGGAVYLLRRHLWRVFPFASLLATFGSYAFWTYYHDFLTLPGVGVPPVHPVYHGTGGFWIEATFLFVYWALFTWVAFTAQKGTLPSLRRAGFVSLNNGAFYLLVTWLVLGEGTGWFWKWSLTFGVVLLVMAEACRRLPRPADPRTEDAYLLQGVLFLTTGFVAYFDGWQLSLVLAIQAVTLLAAAGRRSSRLLLGCSMVTALLAFGWAVRAFNVPAPTSPWLTPLGVGAVLVGAAYLAQRLKEAQPSEKHLFSFGRCLDPVPSYYALLGAAVWLALISDRIVNDDAKILSFAGAALVLTASVYVLRVKALPVYAQGFLAAGVLDWFLGEVMRFNPTEVPAGSTTLGLGVAILLLGHWWQRLPGAPAWKPGKLSRLLNVADATLVVTLVLWWFQMEIWPVHDHDGVPVAETASLALAAFAYGVATRYRALAVAGQACLVLSILFLLHLTEYAWAGSIREAFLAATPLLAVLVMFTAGWFLAPSSTRGLPLRITTIAYELAALLIFFVWTEHYLPNGSILAVYSLTGAAIFVLSVEVGVRRWSFMSLVPTVAGLLLFLSTESNGEHADFLNLLGAVILAGQQQFGRRRLGDRLPKWFPARIQGALMTAATLCAWVFLTARVARWHDSSFGLSAAWSLFAASVFAAGLLLHERVYRWLGLGVLAVTLGHIVFFDIKEFDSLAGIISLFALAMVLLGVGFLYNKYHDKFRDLL